MIVCHKCSTTLIEGQRICPACGADNSETSRPKEVSAPMPPPAERATTPSTHKPASKSVLNSTTKAFIAPGLAILFAAGLVFWQVKASRAGTINLTADDLAKLVESFPPQARMQL